MFRYCTSIQSILNTGFKSTKLPNWDANPNLSNLATKKKNSINYSTDNHYSNEKKAILDYANAHLFPAVSRLSDMVISKSKGSYMWDIDGKRYIDFICGIAVTGTGHAHPRVVKAIREQIENGFHYQINVGLHLPMIGLTKELLQILPKQFDRIFYTNSGAEAVESAIKIARSFSKKHKIICFRGGYHGRTIGTMSLTSSKSVYHAGFGPLVPGVIVAPFPYFYRSPMYQYQLSLSNSVESMDQLEEFYLNTILQELEELLITQVDPQDVAAFLIEPILGEAGYIIPPKRFLKALSDLAKKNNILLIADEVQTGFCRTGKWFAFEHFDIVPDLVVMAKGIASGMPLSAVASPSKYLVNLDPGSMGGTYSGNVVSCAAGIETIRVMKDEHFLTNVQQQSQGLEKKLNFFKKNSKYHIGQVRVIGLMAAIEFNDKEVDKGIAARLVKECISRGLLIMTAGPFETIRFMPPLNVSAETMTTALEILEESLDQIFKNFGRCGI